MEPQELEQQIDVMQVVDVREDDEWRVGHIQGAHHIPMGEVGDRLSELSDDRRIVTVCRSGKRSSEVADDLRSKGFDVENLDGGMQAWEQAGLPIVADDGTPGGVA